MQKKLMMPTLGLTMTEGTVDFWYKKLGEEVAEGEAVCQISSEKLTHDVKAPIGGKLLKITAEVGETVPCQGEIGVVGTGELLTEEPLEVVEEAIVEAEPTPEISGPLTEAEVIKEERILATPSARRLAAEKGYDLAEIQSSSGKERLTRRDVEQYVPLEAEVTRAITVVEDEGEGLTGRRHIIAHRMHQSLQTTAQVSLNIKVDVTDLAYFRKRVVTEESEENVKNAFGWTPLVVKAVALGLKAYPAMNAWYGNEVHQQVAKIHLGIATALDEGLVVPVLRDVEGLSLGKIAERLGTLITQTRSGELPGDLYGGSTFSISNMGHTGVEYFTPILNSPEIGILGVGSLTSELAFAADQRVVARKMLPLSLTFDHQVVDGDLAGRFLQEIKNNLEKPAKLFI